MYTGVSISVPFYFSPLIQNFCWDLFPLYLCNARKRSSTDVRINLFLYLPGHLSSSLSISLWDDLQTDVCWTQFRKLQIWNFSCLWKFHKQKIQNFCLCFRSLLYLLCLWVWSLNPFGESSLGGSWVLFPLELLLGPMLCIFTMMTNQKATLLPFSRYSVGFILVSSMLMNITSGIYYSVSLSWILSPTGMFLFLAWMVVFPSIVVLYISYLNTS